MKQGVENVYMPLLIPESLLLGVLFGLVIESLLLVLSFSMQKEGDSNGSHSFVYISHISSGVTMYEANRDIKCGVEYHFRTYANIRAAYPYGFKDVSHNDSSTGINASTDYHRIHCTTSGCAAYIILPHQNVATSTGHVCTVCGSTTGSGPIIIG